MLCNTYEMGNQSGQSSLLYLVVKSSPKSDVVSQVLHKLLILLQNILRCFVVSHYHEVQQKIHEIFKQVNPHCISRPCESEVMVETFNDNFTFQSSIKVTFLQLILLLERSHCGNRPPMSIPVNHRSAMFKNFFEPFGQDNFTMADQIRCPGETFQSNALVLFFYKLVPIDTPSEDDVPPVLARSLLRARVTSNKQKDYPNLSIELITKKAVLPTFEDFRQLALILNAEKLEDSDFWINGEEDNPDWRSRIHYQKLFQRMNQFANQALNQKTFNEIVGDQGIDWPVSQATTARLSFEKLLELMQVLMPIRIALVEGAHRVTLADLVFRCCQFDSSTLNFIARGAWNPNEKEQCSLEPTSTAFHLTSANVWTYTGGDTITDEVCSFFREKSYTTQRLRGLYVQQTYHDIMLAVHDKLRSNKDNTLCITDWGRWFAMNIQDADAMLKTIHESIHHIITDIVYDVPKTHEQACSNKDGWKYCTAVINRFGVMFEMIGMVRF